MRKILNKNLGQGSQITEYQRGYMCVMHELGYSAKQIQQNEFISINGLQIYKKQKVNNKGFSARTIQRVLNKNGLISRRKRVMQSIAEKYQQKRFQLSKIYRGWSKKELNKIFYSDENNICLTNNGIHLVRKRDNEDWSDIRFRKEQKSHPLSINIWMYISYQYGVESIKWTSVSWIDGKYYRNNILSKYILNNQKLKKGSTQSGIFQQDQAKGHIAKKTLEFLAKHKVEVLD
ncbi:hypothetical protein ABPG72_016560 [Tetrahymena utriculariae]